MSILEDLWQGKIYPYEQFVKNNEAHAKVLRRLVVEKDRLLPNVPEKLRDPLDKLLDVQMELNIVAERAAFTTGFCLATQLLLDSLC